MSKLILPFYLILAFCAYAQDTHIPEPYASINVLSPDWQGWFSPENKENLERFITTYKPQCVVELGSWLGLSAACMARALPEGAKLYAVDDWTAASDIYIQNTPGLELKLPALYQQFLSNIREAQLCTKIIPVRMKTLEAAKALNITPDLIYVDASHDETSVYNDIIAWYPKLKKGGIMCGDDWKHFESVQKAVRRAAAEFNTSIETEGNFWYFSPFKQ